MSITKGSLHAAARRARVWALINEVPVLPVREIAKREGMTERNLRCIIKRLELENDFSYPGWGLRQAATLSDESQRLRSRLADHLYRLREREGCAKVATLVGLNLREQLRAANRPFSHDWSLSQMERLAQAVGCGLAELA